MTPYPLRRVTCSAVATALVMLSASVSAQEITGRVTMEAVASVSVTSDTADDPFLIFDAVSTIRLGRGWDGVVRPWARRMPGGDWGAEMYQLQLRYTSSTHIPFRFDAGIISSPMGLATLELRPDRNPTIGAPFYYFVPLPAMDGRFDRVTLMSGGYPLGALISASGPRWDVRGGVTDDTPARGRSVLSASRVAATPQFIAGGGVTPVAGFRLGAAVARGGYRSSSVDAKGVAVPAASATVFNIEGEYAIGYTRIAGEWIVDRFDTRISPAIARGFNLQATRTLSPRWFAAGRTVHASSPVLAGPYAGRRSASSGEATLGYRLTPEFTLRGGYQGSTAFNRASWDHALAVSFVWGQRWW
jgi:hypothetical protein